jgi:ParB-like chromosome segregation protein Spo0J
VAKHQSAAKKDRPQSGVEAIGKLHEEFGAQLGRLPPIVLADELESPKESDASSTMTGDTFEKDHVDDDSFEAGIPASVEVADQVNQHSSAASTDRTVDLSPTMQIRVDQIDPDDSNNPRLHLINVNNLMVGMENSGTTHAPIIVQAIDDPESPYKWRRLAGSRRFQAAKTLGWEFIDARIYTGGAMDAHFLRFVDNEGHEGLNPFEKAAYFRSTKLKFDFSTSELVRELETRGIKVSVSYVDNLIHAYDALLPEIRDAWRDQYKKPKEQQLLTTDLINHLKKLRATQQLETWRRVQNGEDWKKIKFETQPTSERKPAAQPKVGGWTSTNTYRDALQALSSAKLEPKVKDTVRGVLNSIMTGSPLRIGAFYFDPFKPAEKSLGAKTSPRKTQNKPTAKAQPKKAKKATRAR